jgi:uncharacterized protein (TIGR02588 family)
MAKREQHEKEEREKRRLEAISAAIGAVLALATLGIIVWDGFADDGRPPVIVIEALEVHQNESGFIVEISVSNEGDKAAAQVSVEGTLSRGGEIVETSDATFDYVASKSQRRGGLFFSQDPRGFDVKVRPKGYVKP